MSTPALLMWSSEHNSIQSVLSYLCVCSRNQLKVVWLACQKLAIYESQDGIFMYLFILSVCEHVLKCQGPQVEVKRQLSGLCFVFPLCGFLRSWWDSGPQPWWQATSPTQLSHGTVSFLKIFIYVYVCVH